MKRQSPSGPAGEFGEPGRTVGRGSAPGALESVDRRLRIGSAQSTVGAVAGRVEAVFLGNLPGFAGPWLSQYAHDVALAHGPVGLLRLDNQRVELELLTGQAAANWSDESWGDEQEPQGSRASATLVERMANLAEGNDALCREPVARWLVSLTNQPSGFARLAAAHAPHWTFVLGADDMAVNAAAKSIAHLVSLIEEASTPDIAAVVMGSDEAHSRAAVAKLNAALDPSLNLSIAFAGCRQRMRPVHLERVAGEPMTDAAWSQLAMFFDRVSAAAAPRPARPCDDEPATSRSCDVAPATDAIESRSAVDAAAPPDKDIEPMVHPAAPPKPALSEAPDRPIPDPRRAPAAAVTATSEPDLCAFLADCGALVRMDARCPDHPATQLMLDEAGRLHLLVRHTAPPQGSADASLRTALIDLIEARNWAVRHIDLLRLTQRQCMFDTAAAPMLHLFTDKAKIAAALIGRVGADVKLHLLQRVTLTTESGWFSTELN